MPEINLLPWREKKRERDKREFAIMVFFALVAGACIIILSNLFVSSLVDNQTLRNQMLQTEIDQLNKQIKDIKMLAAIRKALVSRMQIVQGLQATRPLTVHLFDELIKVLPNGVYLYNVKRVGNQVTVLGYADSNSDVSILMKNIEKNAWFHQPYLTEIKKREEDDNASKTNQDVKNNNQNDQNEFKLSFTLAAT